MNLEIKFQAHDLSERRTHLNYSRYKLLIISMNCKYLLSVSGFLFTVYIIFSFYSHLKFESTKLLPEILRFCFSDEKVFSSWDYPSRNFSSLEILPFILTPFVLFRTNYDLLCEIQNQYLIFFCVNNQFSKLYGINSMSFPWLTGHLV